MSFPPSVGRYRIDRVLGSGAFASVWLGHDDALESQVAIKVLSGSLIDDLDVRNRFLEEARILRRADSERLVRVHDIGELPDGRPYFVMSYADRGTLGDRMRERPLPVSDAVALAEQIAYGVEVINTLGVIHRDLKPSNVLFQSTPDGGEKLLIADLGLAKALAHASGAFTLPVGTPGYMSPEQARFGGGLDVRADVYGLGALTYHMLTGRAPGPAPVKTAPSELREEVTPAFDQVILRALESEREKRWPTAEAFAEALSTLRPTSTPSAAGAAAAAAGGGAAGGSAAGGGAAAPSQTPKFNADSTVQDFYQDGTPSRPAAQGQPSTQGQAPAQGQPSAQGQAPVQGQAPAQGQGQPSIQGQAPGQGQPSAQGQAPAQGQPSAQGQVPGQGQAAVPGQVPVQGATPGPPPPAQSGPREMQTRFDQPGEDDGRTSEMHVPSGASLGEQTIVDSPAGLAGPDNPMTTPDVDKDRTAAMQAPYPGPPQGGGGQGGHSDGNTAVFPTQPPQNAAPPPGGQQGPPPTGFQAPPGPGPMQGQGPPPGGKQGGGARKKFVTPLIITAVVLVVALLGGLVLGVLFSGDDDKKKDDKKEPTLPKDFAAIADASGKIKAAAPKAWPKQQQATWPPSSVGLNDAQQRPVLRATPSMGAFLGDGTGPGVFLGMTTDVRPNLLPPPGAIAHRLCTRGAPENYTTPDKALSGTIIRFTGCKIGTPSVTEVGLRDKAGKFGLWIRVKEADGRNATKDILDNLKVTGP